MTDCESSERLASMELSFIGCAEHGAFTLDNGQFRTDGIDPLEAIDGFLSVIEETISVQVMQHEGMQKILTTERTWPWSSGETSEPMPERAQQWLARLMAHQILLEHVAENNYQTDRRSGYLSLPRD